MTRIGFRDLHNGERVELSDFDLVVAGYTGRDPASVQAHIDELALIGVPSPERVPTFIELDPELLTSDPRIRVEGRTTSGEAEPVLVRAGGRLYLTVGSDHTDRELERDSLKRSKAACPKPICSFVIPMPDASDWDKTDVRSYLNGTLCQSGSLKSVRDFTDLLAEYEGADDGGDLVMFGGTVPLVAEGFQFGEEWTVLLIPPTGPELRHRYHLYTDPS